MKIVRRLTQLAFLVLVIVGVFIVNGHCERWCPLGGVEALYSYVTNGTMTCSLGVANFFILGAVLLMTLLLRRAFCGYVCPIGAISEWVYDLGRALGMKRRQVPYVLDRSLALLKYAVLAFILYITWTSGELLFRAADPCYALISRHGKDITIWAYVVSGAVVLGSLFVMVPFCRWLCPLAAIFTPFSRIAPTRVHRDEATCVDCGICQRVCPMNIKVDQVRQVTASRCTACLDCVSACPKLADGALWWGLPKGWGGRLPQVAILVVILACIGAAVAATYAFPLPSFVQSRGDAPAETASVSLEVVGVTCRGSSSDLVDRWLGRDDDYALAGYVKVETWPNPTVARVRVTFDPSRTTAEKVRQAIVMPYYDFLGGSLEVSPFEIQGYRPAVDDL